MKEMIFIISPKAEVTLTVKGVSGPACREFTKNTEQELGIVTSRESTSDAYQGETEVITLEE